MIQVNPSQRSLKHHVKVLNIDVSFKKRPQGRFFYVFFKKSLPIILRFVECAPLRRDRPNGNTEEGLSVTLQSSTGNGF